MLSEQHQRSLSLFCCSNYDNFSRRTFNLERSLATSSERVENVFFRKVCQIQETLFVKLDSLGIKYTSEQELFKVFLLFNFESFCVQEETFKDTDTTTWIGKYLPNYVSIPSNSVEQPNFIYNSDPHHHVAYINGVLEILASQSKAK